MLLYGDSQVPHSGRQERGHVTAFQGGFRIGFSDLFPFGAGVVSAVSQLNDFDRSTRENPIQARDQDTGLPVWQVDVMDFDPDARERTHEVKILGEVQPVPPDLLAGTPVRPVMLENLVVTPYIKEGKYPKIACSLKATGMSAPRRGDQPKAA